MGNRVAKMEYPNEAYPGLDGIGYCVYQSTSMACFWPIFHNQLAAHCFAHVLNINYPNWSDKEQEEMADSVNAFISERFGDEPENNDAYHQALEAEDLPICNEFISWRVGAKAGGRP